MSIIYHFEILRKANHHSPVSIQCDALRAAALDTWSRIGFSRKRPGLKIHETTITQNLVYELNLLNCYLPSGIGISIFESTNEKANGDDLEIKVQISSGGFITFATQAKILYHNIPIPKSKLKSLSDGRYQEMKHPKRRNKGGKSQLSLLLNYAKTNGCIPIYLLYNFIDNWHFTSSECSFNFDEKQYGCSIVSALYLRTQYANSKINLPPTIRFSDLHTKYAKPWFILGCCFSSMSADEAMKQFGEEKADYNIKIETKLEAEDNGKWRPIFSESNFNSFNGQENYFEKIRKAFIPKFRLIIRNLNL